MPTRFLYLTVFFFAGRPALAAAPPNTGSQIVQKDETSRKSSLLHGRSIHGGGPVVEELHNHNLDGQSSPDASPQQLYAKGYDRYQRADYVGAIFYWEQAYDLLPVTERGDLTIQLAYAHKFAYKRGDDDPTHLHRALVLFSDHLASLDASADDTRRDVAAEIADVKVKLAEIKTERIQVKQEIAKAEATAAASARKVIVLRHLQTLNPWGSQEQREFKALFSAGGTMLTMAAIGFSALSLQTLLANPLNDLPANFLAVNVSTFTITGSLLLATALTRRRQAMTYLRKSAGIRNILSEAECNVIYDADSPSIPRPNDDADDEDADDEDTD